MAFSELPGYDEFKKINKVAERSAQKIQMDNIVQLVYIAVKECRFIYYYNSDGTRIIH